MNVKLKNNSSALSKNAFIFAGAILFLVSLSSNATCTPVNGTINSTATVNLSDEFTTATEYTSTLNTGWEGYLTCDILSSLGTSLYFLSAASTNGYPVRFTDSSKDIDQVITFYVVPAKKTATGYWIIGSNPVSNTDYTFTAKTGNTSTNEVSTTTSSGSVSLVTVALTDSSSYTAAWIRENYSTASGIKAYALLTVTFDPDVTTCNVDDQYFTLPSVTLAALRSGDSGDTSFAVNIDCSGSLNDKATRGANVRLYSNDIVDSGHYVIRNSASTSAGIGFQLFNNSVDPVIFSDTASSESTSLWSMAKNSTLSGNDTFTLGARYKIFDNASLSAGSVVGTVIAYIEYD